MRVRAALAAAATCVVTTALITSCSSPVPVPPPDPSAEERALCATVMDALPDTVLDQSRRDTEAPELTAAWGNPPISIRCGVDKPKALGPDAQCFEVNHVGWFAEEGVGGMVFTTIGRPVYIEVGVPSEYAPEANALVDVAAAVATVPAEQPCV